MKANQLPTKTLLLASLLAAGAFSANANADANGRYTCYGYAGSTAPLLDTATQTVVIGVTHNNPNTRAQKIEKIRVRDAAGRRVDHVENLTVPGRGSVSPIDAIVTGAVPGAYSVQVFWSQTNVDQKRPVPQASSLLYDATGVLKGGAPLSCVDF